MVWASAGNLPEQNKSNECVNRPPGTAVKKYAGTHDLPCTFCLIPIRPQQDIRHPFRGAAHLFTDSFQVNSGSAFNDKLIMCAW